MSPLATKDRLSTKYRSAAPIGTLAGNAVAVQVRPSSSLRASTGAAPPPLPPTSLPSATQRRPGTRGSSANDSTADAQPRSRVNAWSSSGSHRSPSQRKMPPTSVRE